MITPVFAIYCSTIVIRLDLDWCSVYQVSFLQDSLTEHCHHVAKNSIIVSTVLVEYFSPLFFTTERLKYFLLWPLVVAKHTDRTVFVIDARQYLEDLDKGQCSLAFLSCGTLVFKCLILCVLIVICDRLCSQINDDDDVTT